MLPEARKEGLEIQEIGDEILVYDVQRGRAHTLNALAAAVWRSCDGHTSPADMAVALRERFGEVGGEKPIRLAVKKLDGAKLLQPCAAAGKTALTRRHMIREAALAGLKLVILPVIMSIPMRPALGQSSCASGQFGNCSGSCPPNSSCTQVAKTGQCLCM